MSRYSNRSRSSHFAPYVSVAERKAKAVAAAKKYVKKGEKLQPVVIAGRKIALSKWGAGWCDHLEKFHDYFNRLERGRRYARNGSVIHLAITPGEATALVSGSSIYKVFIKIEPLDAERWQQISKKCSGEISSMIDLLAGRFADGIMAVLADPKTGMFPGSNEITMKCSCPDGAAMCKHIAAVLYGIGARLDSAPELLFTFRQVNPADLVQAAAHGEELIGKAPVDGIILSEGDESSFSELFGIELAAPSATKKSTKTAAKAVAKGATKNALKPAKKQPGSDKEKTFPLVSATELLGMGCTRSDIARFLKHGVLKKHSRGIYQTTEATRAALPKS